LAEKEAGYGAGVGLEDEDFVVDDELEADGGCGKALALYTKKCDFGVCERTLNWMTI